jgi:hypothetical protein
MAQGVGALLLAIIFSHGLASKLTTATFPSPEASAQAVAAARAFMAEQYGQDWVEQCLASVRSNRARADEILSTYGQVVAGSYADTAPSGEN